MGPLETWEEAHELWQRVLEDWDSLLWEIPNVKSNHVEKTCHPCQFPIELVQRCVLALTNPGDLVLDPFLGVGSTTLASLMHGRRALGFDTDPIYITETETRIEQLKAGTLPVRQLGKAVHKPTGRDRVSQFPDEWKNPPTEA